MRTLAGSAVTAINAGVLRIAQLVYMDFPGFPVALCSANWNLDYSGVTYLGAAGLGAISPVNDSAGEIKGLSFEMSGVSTDAISLALDDAAIVQGTPVTIRTAILNDSYQVVDAPIDWTGRLDTMSIQEDGDTCTIGVTAESTAVDLLRGTPLTYSDADQKSMFPGDRAFEFVISQSGQRVVWPAKQWLLASSR